MGYLLIKGLKTEWEWARCLLWWWWLLLLPVLWWNLIFCLLVCCGAIVVVVVVVVLSWLRHLRKDDDDDLFFKTEWEWARCMMMVVAVTCTLVATYCISQMKQVLIIDAMRSNCWCCCCYSSLVTQLRWGDYQRTTTTTIMPLSFTTTTTTTTIISVIYFVSWGISFITKHILLKYMMMSTTTHNSISLLTLLLDLARLTIWCTRSSNVYWCFFMSMVDVSICNFFLLEFFFFLLLLVMLMLMAVEILCHH